MWETIDFMWFFLYICTGMTICHMYIQTCIHMCVHQSKIVAVFIYGFSWFHFQSLNLDFIVRVESGQHALGILHLFLPRLKVHYVPYVSHGAGEQNLCLYACSASSFIHWTIFSALDASPLSVHSSLNYSFEHSCPCFICCAVTVLSPEEESLLCQASVCDNKR